MANFIYNAGKAIASTVALANETIGVLLLDAAGTYTPDPNHVFVAELDPDNNELDIVSYDRKTLTGLAADIDTGNDAALLLADSVTWVDLGDGEDPMPTVQAAVLFVEGSDDTDSVLLRYIDSVSGQLNGEDATLAWGDGVVLRVT